MFVFCMLFLKPKLFLSDNSVINFLFLSIKTNGNLQLVLKVVLVLSNLSNAHVHTLMFGLQRKSFLLWI